MNSKIYFGELIHASFEPVCHRFAYPVYFYALDIDELPLLDQGSWLFGYNRIRPVAVHDRDYVGPEAGSIRDKLQVFLARQGIERLLGKVVLVTAARYLHYARNPVSFFYCYDQEGTAIAVIAQISNAFQETHLYLLPCSLGERVGGKLRFSTEKVFHVSPFFPREGHYEFFLSEPGGNVLDLLIHYRVEDRVAMIARFRGEGGPISEGSLAGLLLRHPLCAALTRPRIWCQAARLRWKNDLPVYVKPKPASPWTIRLAPASFQEKLGMRALCHYFRNLPVGTVQIELPDGRPLLPAADDGSASYRLLVNNPRFFRRVLLGGEIGFGESYTDGDWSTADLPALLTLLASNIPVLDERNPLAVLAGRFANRLRQRRRSDTLMGSLETVEDSPDLDNHFFSLILDPGMTYSSGYFATEEDSLEDGQLNKLHRIIHKAQLTSEDHVLEIGCGWGSFAIEAVQQSGCRVTGITLSVEQLDFARQRVREAGLEQQIDLQLCDYRDVQGQYSRIVSIEMLETVGHEYLAEFFEICDARLKPGGRAVIQAITLPDQKYKAYRKSSDWIRTHNFPGGHLPSLGALAIAMGQDSRLGVVHLEEFGLHYARTLDRWRENLLQQWPAILALGYDDYFLRAWDYYFAYCSAGFRARILHCSQFILTRVGEV